MCIRYREGTLADILDHARLTRPDGNTRGPLSFGRVIPPEIDILQKSRIESLGYNWTNGMIGHCLTHPTHAIPHLHGRIAGGIQRLQEIRPFQDLLVDPPKRRLQPVSYTH